MQEGIQCGALNPDKGLNTRKFLLAILAFLIFACVAMYAWTRYTAAKGGLHVQPVGHAGGGATATDKGGNS